MIRKWPEIVSLSTVRASAQFRGGIIPRVRYKAKIKLHGTNSGVRLRKGKVEAFQSRNRDITPTDDNAGFARWAEGVQWPEIQYRGPDDGVVVIHGEWAGPGVMGGTSCANLDSKKFFIFAIEFSSDVRNEEIGDWEFRLLITNPEDINALLGDFQNENVRVLPWYANLQGTVDLGSDESAKAFADELEKVVAQIEDCDPYIKETFGVSGPGEGVVLYPDGCPAVSAWGSYSFKAKGEKHRVKASNRAVEIAPEVLGDVKSFVAAFVTPARCEQGLNAACGGRADIRKLGDFISWMSADVQKESSAELSASNLTWKQVSGETTKAARAWFQDKIKQGS